MKLDYCRLMRKLEARPDDPVGITVGQLLEFKAHIASCDACRAAADRVNAISARDVRFGPRPEPN